jgi:hypothetical protein
VSFGGGGAADVTLGFALAGEGSCFFGCRFGEDSTIANNPEQATETQIKGHQRWRLRGNRAKFFHSFSPTFIARNPSKDGRERIYSKY